MNFKSLFKSSIFLTAYFFVMFPSAQAVGFSATLDIEGVFGEDKSKRNAFRVRHAEWMLEAPIGSLFEGRLSLGARSIYGEMPVRLEEAFVSSTQLMRNSNLRLGHFYLATGRLNRERAYTRAFTSTPAFQEKFFGAEGVRDTGIEWAMSWPSTWNFELLLGAGEGLFLGDSNWDLRGEEPAKPQTLTHYARMSVSGDLTSSWSFEESLIYLGRTNPAGVEERYFGLDLLSSVQLGAQRVLLFQSELWLRQERASSGADFESEWGGFLFVEYPFSSKLGAGILFDYFKEKEALDQSEYSLAPNLRWSLDESVSLRGSVHWRQTQSGADAENDWQVQTQFVFYL